jgi:hypothetical protein
MGFYVKDVGEGRMHILKRRTAHDQAPSAKQQVREILGSLPRQMLQEVHDMCRDHLGRSAGDHALDDRTDESGLYRLDVDGNCTGEIAGRISTQLSARAGAGTRTRRPSPSVSRCRPMTGCAARPARLDS